MSLLSDSFRFEDPKTATPPENTHCDFPVGGEKPSPEAYSAMVAHKTPLPLPNFTFKNERQLYPVLRVKGYTVQVFHSIISVVTVPVGNKTFTSFFL